MEIDVTYEWAPPICKQLNLLEEASSKIESQSQEDQTQVGKTPYIIDDEAEKSAHCSKKRQNQWTPCPGRNPSIAEAEEGKYEELEEDLCTCIISVENPEWSMKLQEIS